MKDIIKVNGIVKYTLRDANGKIKDQRKVKNLITDDGFDFICAVMGNPTQPNDMEYIAIGDGDQVGGATAADVTDTTLQHELGRALGAYAHTDGIASKAYTMTVTYGAGVNTGAITESGMLNAAVAGTLLNRQTFAVINKGAADSLEVEWTITLS